MMLFNAFILFFCIKFASCASLSDPLGLYPDDLVDNFHGELGTGYDYVKGQALPKPQKESRTGKMLALTYVDLFYICLLVQLPLA